MKKRFRMPVLLLTAAMLLVLLCGCVMTDIQVRFTDDGRVGYNIEELVPKSEIDAEGQTPQEYFKDELEAGETLTSRTIDSGEYWGIASETVWYDTLEEFLALVEDGTISEFRVETSVKEGRQTAAFTIDVPSRAEAIEDTGAENDPDLAGKIVKVINIYFPEGVAEYTDDDAVAVSPDKHFAEATLHLREEAYSVTIKGYLSNKYIINANLKIGKPEEGWSPAEKMKEARLEVYPMGAADIGNASWLWYDGSRGKESVMDPEEEFLAGHTYYFDCTVPVNDGFLVSDDVICRLWDETNEGLYVGRTGSCLYIEGQYTLPGEYVAKPSDPVPAAAEEPQTGGEAPAEVTTEPAPSGQGEIGGTAPAEPEKPAEEKPEEQEMIKANIMPFKDVSMDDYFFDAVVWAFGHEPQITDGTSETTFSPDKTCTRGQVVTFLWRSAGCPEPETANNPFTDVKENDYFYDAVLWAVKNGITDGTSPTTFSPKSTCKNSHILTFIYRAVGEPGKTGEGAWWQDAYDWADLKGLLTGSYEGKYDINAECPRANVVYYLWQMQK